jgi:hypothetical protein
MDADIQMKSGPTERNHVIMPQSAVRIGDKKRKKSPRSCDLGLNPPKEEGGGDNRGM